MRLSVIGCGYLGATHAVAMAALGHDVLGLDSDIGKVKALSTGRVPFVEQGLDELLAEQLAAGRLRFTTSYAEVAAHAELHFLGVGTPSQPGADAYDLSHLFTATCQLAAHLERPAVIVVKSTVPVGTVARLAEKVHAAAPAGDAVELAFNPEFLRESHGIDDTLHPDRIVVGTVAPGTRAEAAVREAYATIIDAGTPLIVTDLATSELVKSAANAFLATKISFINAMAEVCETVGADVYQLADAIGRDLRIGKRALHPGIGYGGGCLPKDLRGFASRAAELGIDSVVDLLHQVDDINVRRRERVVALARHACGGDLTGKRLTVLGAAFKPGTDDIRDSPALAIAGQLHLAGAQVTVTDPLALDNARKAHPFLDYEHDVATAIEGAHLTLHLTEWPQYTELDPAAMLTRASTATVIDGRGTLDPARWREAGWTFRSLGRS